MRKLKYLLLILFLFPVLVYADKIYDLKMNVNINKDGNANITEVWTVKAEDGSEWYKTMNNMGNMKLYNYKVSMDGKELSYEKDWNVNGNLNDKKGKYGINYIDDRIELCFGKNDFNKHTFTLSYTLDNIIFNTEDSQVLYNTFFPNASADSFKVTVSGYYNFPDTLDVWGYGYKGYAYVKDGKIEMSSEGSLDDEYVVLLAKFPLETFNTNNSYDDYTTFEDVYNMAEEGTYEYDYNDDNFVSFMSSNSEYIGPLILIIIFVLAGTFGVVNAKSSGYGYRDNKKITNDNAPIFRDIPCNKDIYYANALNYLNNFNYKESNIYGAIILKWVKQNKIKFIKDQKTGLFNKESSSLDLRMNPSFDNETEKKLFDMMYKASKDGILESKELEKWCRSNYMSFLSIFQRMRDTKVLVLENEGHIYKRTSKEECKKKKVMDDVLYNESVKLYGLRRYLIEFSSMDKKEVFDVHLWDEYLMFAYLFGIADKVAKQLKNLYPDVMEKSDFDFDTIMFVNVLSTRSYNAATSARSAAENYTAGGGGFSSGGGGGGSFGGGGSMGGR